MGKIKFRDIRMSKKNREKLDVINSIVEEYQANGYVLTLRQLYYQLVSRDIIPNNQSEYGKISTLLKEGRMAGVVDWDAIEDRLRKPYKPASFDDPGDALGAVINQYELPRMEGQPVYLEVWVEKDALSDVLSRVTRKYHIPILVNRGYSSVSAMYDSFMRFLQRGVHEERPVKILYLGDYDPSGLDMIRDVRERIEEFCVGYGGDVMLEDMSFQIDHIALTMDQIREYDPPPNPAKVSDPRAEEFIKHHGTTSWEVDALRPESLNNILDEAILEEIDYDQYLSVVNEEYAHREKLSSLRDYL